MSTARPFTLNGLHVLIAMLTFFVAIVAVNVAFVVLAVKSFPGEDVRRSYLQGLNYNATIAERRGQAARGWGAGAALVSRDGAAVLEVTLRDDAGAAISNARLTGELRRPMTSRFDRSLEFIAVGEGIYRARVGAIEQGAWRLRARASAANGEALDFGAELTWPASP